MNRRLARTAFVALSIAVGGALVAGCSSDDEPASPSDTSATPSTEAITEPSGEPAPGEPSAEAALEEERIVLDVRTLEEFDESHVIVARNYDLQGADFDAQINELNADDKYIVYSGDDQRSAQAAKEMGAIGLDVLDGGELKDMSFGGWPRS